MLTTREGGKKRHKGKFFIQFSFSFWFRRSKRILAWTRFCAVRLETYRREKALICCITL
jgi:hypothetical protein